MILPKFSLNPQRPECKPGSSCCIFHTFSENHSLENSPWGEQGLSVGQGVCGRSTNLDLCLALMAFSSVWGFFYLPHLLRHGASVISKRPVIITSKCRALGEGAITAYFPRFDVAGTSHRHLYRLVALYYI
jgi:hypothetical protein